MQIITLGLNPAIDRIVSCAALTPGEHLAVELLAEIPAGKSVNVSRALALLNHDSLATGFIGRQDADFFIRGLAELSPGAARSSWITVAGRTRENLSIIETASGRETHLRQPGFTVDGQDLRELSDRLVRILDPGDIVVVAGSLPQGIKPEDFGELLSLLETRQVRIALDTSGEPLRIGLRRAVWFAKPNASELSEAMGLKLADDPAVIVRQLRDSAIMAEMLLISRGAQGAMLIDFKSGGAAWTAQSRCSRPVVRTVSCGDHLLAGFTAAQIRGMDLPASLGFGVALATARAVSADFECFNAGIFAELLPCTSVKAISYVSAAGGVDAPGAARL